MIQGLNKNSWSRKYKEIHDTILETKRLAALGGSTVEGQLSDKKNVSSKQMEGSGGHGGGRQAENVQNIHLVE